jgi:hypothetical protein
MSTIVIVALMLLLVGVLPTWRTVPTGDITPAGDRI